MEDWIAKEGYPGLGGDAYVERLDAVNFAIYSKHATAVRLNLYRRDSVVEPFFTYDFDPISNKTGRIWHCILPGATVRDGAYYSYTIDGPSAPAQGLRFDREKVLLDPYAKGVFFPPEFDRDAARGPGPNSGRSPLGVLCCTRQEYQWGGDRRPRMHGHDLVIYETHVRQFTAHPSSGVSADRRGTYSGLVDKIPYLNDLGVTAVELMPVFQTDPQDGSSWGYMPLAFFALQGQYAQSAGAAEQLDEFRDMVRALHDAGIEVILDVVYNHTTEGDHTGPTYSLRGVDNPTYYLLEEDRTFYRNDTGTGNMIRADNWFVRTFILDSLRYWVREMHIDGFRFDLASVFTRRGDGSINLDDPPIISAIRADPTLRDVRLIAEAWDLGAYQLGRAFPGIYWTQWNGKFRDDIRSFVRGDEAMVPTLMRRLYGSDDLFPDTLPDSYRPYQGVNFVTSHDGFTLYDLVSYNEKHNEANGHENRDGADDNRSWNHGWEGDVGVPEAIKALRFRQVKNFAAILMLSNGVPMFRAGDEFLQTQGGNNNPYNQDNETTWLNWNRRDGSTDVHRFFQKMIAFRAAHPTIGRSTFWRSDVTWYGSDGTADLADYSHSVAYLLSGGSEDDDDLYVMINAWDEAIDFTIQVGGTWHRVVDTGIDSPEDIAGDLVGRPIPTATYRVGPRSVVVLVEPRG
ncbi:MAG TPA: isoamylase [Acidimicrobiia bacterium]|nr:isoamylase [Acidimicrobiia bacterium]